MLAALFKYKTVILYSFCLAALLLLMRWLELRFLILDLKMDIYGGLIALIFMGLGVWITLKLVKPKMETVIIETEVYRAPPQTFAINKAELERLAISRRELEVLQFMALGLSNAEIAEQMFVSLNTVKTHSSKLFEKLDVKRRTQAVETARRAGIIA